MTTQPSTDPLVTVQVKQQAVFFGGKQNLKGQLIQCTAAQAAAFGEMVRPWPPVKAVAAATLPSQGTATATAAHDVAAEEAHIEQELADLKAREASASSTNATETK